MIYIVAFIGMMATLVVTLAFDWSLQSFGMAAVLFISLLFLAAKAESARRQSEASRRQLQDLDRLRVAYEQLDQQAKLVIRTDLELHQTQEELDRRLASLMSLHQLGRQLQVSLRPDEVYSKLDAAIVTNFGFAKGLLGLCASFKSVEWHALVGVSDAASEEIKTLLLESTLLKQILTNPAPATLRATATITQPQRQLLELLGIPNAVVAGIIPHSGPAGCLVLGRAVGGVTNTKADEELVAILANQLATAVENSALYEATWASQRELERKVQQRTRELADANAELVRLNKAKSDFVSVVSHELRTPLAAIKGYASLLATGQFGALAQPQGDRVLKIERQADLLTRLINNLLDIARIESGHVTMERRSIPLEEFFTAVQELVLPQLEAKHLKYTIDMDGVKELVGDPQHLQRVFVNLLSNAVKYTPEKGSIRVAVERKDDVVLTSVSDTGCGIPAEDLPKLFQEFYRANDPINQQVRGTGLGLALVKRIVEAHQGRIWVDSEKGRGSTFFVKLPAV